MVAAGALSRISPDGVWRFSVKKYCETSRLLALSGRCQNEYSCQKRFVNFPMVTGGKGISVIAPLTPTAEWPSMKDFAHRFATAQAQAEPDRFTAALAKARRTEKFFIDYLRNQRGATAVMPYRARARQFEPIALPLR